MGTKIDYIALLKPLETMLSTPELTDKAKISMTLSVIKEILAQAEKAN